MPEPNGNLLPIQHQTTSQSLPPPQGTSDLSLVSELSHLTPAEAEYIASFMIYTKASVAATAEEARRIRSTRTRRLQLDLMDGIEFIRRHRANIARVRGIASDVHSAYHAGRRVYQAVRDNWHYGERAFRTARHCYRYWTSSHYRDMWDIYKSIRTSGPSLPAGNGGRGVSAVRPSFRKPSRNSRSGRRRR